MYVKNLTLKNYRNIEYANLEFSPHTNIIYGDNAQGKTNLLESIYLCAAGRSHRTHTDKELISFNTDSSFVKLVLKDDVERIDTINMHIKNNAKKGIAVNGLPLKKTGDLLGVLNVVMFSPEDLQLVKNGPGQRRRFMDMELCRISKVYFYNLNQYQRVLKQRNNLLKTLKKYDVSLEVWDIQLCEYGKKIIKAREDFIERLNGISSDIHKNITENSEILTLKYDKNVDIENMEKKLQASADRDIYYGTTTIGPHKDDVIFYINNINVREYGSQGQQRTACLSVKMAEIDLIREYNNVNPILLLDDVLSELDKKRQNYLINNIEDVQTIITCPYIDETLMNISKKSKIFNVFEGKILANN